MKHYLTLFFLLGSFSLAQAEPGIGVGVKAGPNDATLAEDFRVGQYGTSGGLAGHLEWRLGERVAVAGQVELLYAPRGAETIFEGESLGTTRMHYVDVAFTSRPAVWLGSARLYLVIGAGLGILVNAKQANAAGVAVDITDELHRLDVSLVAGVGAAYHFSSAGSGAFRFDSVFLELRHDRGLLDTDAINGGFKNRTTSVMLGLSFMVGSRAPAPDRDGDGIADANDDCPDVAEDVNGFEDGDGCPDDKDGDGVVGGAERCPDVAEDANGFEDDDGCPDEDRRDPDGDGVNADADKCSDQAEDKDGFEDGDGCPDPDNDSDGVLDVDEPVDGSGVSCRDRAETRNGFEDDDGCPDELPQVFADTVDAVCFKAEGKGRLRVAETSQALDTLAEALIEHPSVRVRVVGYPQVKASRRTPSADALRKDALSRAQQVQRYLTARKVVRNGKTERVPSERVVPVAYDDASAVKDGPPSNEDMVARSQCVQIQVVVPTKAPADSAE